MNKYNNEITISFTGDFIPNQETLTLVNGDRMAEFAPDVNKLFDASDLVVTNLEAPLTLNDDPILKTGNNFAAHPENAKLLKDLGIHVACLANNHILDQNEQGVLETIDVCNRNGIDTVGAGSTIKEAQKPIILDVKGKRIGFINFCEHEFSIAGKHTAGANPFDIIDNFRQIKALREKADFIIVVFHGSLEYHHLPMPHYKKACEFFVDAGADVVVGHHTHYYGGYSFYKEKPIFYSLGNFYARSRRRDEKQCVSYILKLIVDDNSIDFNLIPILIQNNLPYVDLNNHFEFNLIKDINVIINDRKQLHDYWSNVFETEKHKILLKAFSFNRVLFRLLKRIPMKFRLTKFQELTFKNYIGCETHSSILKYIIEDFYRKRNN